MAKDRYEIIVKDGKDNRKVVKKFSSNDYNFIMDTLDIVEETYGNIHKIEFIDHKGGC